jgi:two-component system chemotaxis response regulator CheB
VSINTKHDIIAIGASAGGVEALTRLFPALPPDLPAAIFVVLHLSSQGSSRLPNILNLANSLPAAWATNGEKIKPGNIYVAPPGSHLLVKGGRVTLDHGLRENRNRLAIDALFRSAAESYGPRVIGIVLSGYLDDGTAGLQAIKKRRGLTIVQDPDEALAASMPLFAIRHVDIDYCLPVAEIGPLLVRLVYKKGTPKEKRSTKSQTSILSRQVERLRLSSKEKEKLLGRPPRFSCSPKAARLSSAKQRFTCNQSNDPCAKSATEARRGMIHRLARKLEDDVAAQARGKVRPFGRSRHTSPAGQGPTVE